MPKRLLASAVIAIGLSMLTASCGGSAVAGTNAGTARGDQVAGRSIFVNAGCGGCHTLRDAGTTGVVGPNLDRIAPPVDHVAQFVINGGVGMPSFQGSLTHDQIMAVARYVSSVSGY